MPDVTDSDSEGDTSSVGPPVTLEPGTAPAPGAADPPQTDYIVKPHDNLTRKSSLYRVTWCEMQPPDSRSDTDEEEEEVLARKDLGAFMTLTAANRAAYERIGGPESTEQYKKEFDSNGLLTVSAVYWGVGHTVVLGRATVTKETVTTPPSFAVMKRVLNESMSKGERVLIATAGFKDAERVIVEETTKMQERLSMQVSKRKEEGLDGHIGFEIIHKQGDGKTVLSEGVMEFKDLREEFKVVWAEGPVPMCIGKGADEDENQWSEDEDGEW